VVGNAQEKFWVAVGGRRSDVQSIEWYGIAAAVLGVLESTALAYLTPDWAGISARDAAQEGSAPVPSHASPRIHPPHRAPRRCHFSEIGTALYLQWSAGRVLLHCV
jgi:hypothetical protein